MTKKENTMSETKIPDEIQALKDGWVKDPCWDIEDTEGFEAHHDELLEFHKAQDLLWKAKQSMQQNHRREKVMLETGVGHADGDILDVLSTWGEIEHMVSSQDRYVGEVGQVEDQVKIELMQAQIRATLLQAAQLKRIADALESMAWGSAK
jgi:hypothetical protein